MAVSHALTWAVVVGGAEDDFGHSVATTADGGYVIAGTTMSWGAGHADAFLVKVGPTGDTAWLRTYGGGRGHEDGNCVEQTADGGYALAGETGSFGIGSYDVWLVRADVNGNQLWQTCFGKVNSRSYGFSVLEHEDGSVLIAGALGTNLFLAKTTATGESLWGAVYEHSVWDECRGACRVSDGGYVLVGSAYGGQSRGNDILLLKADASGVLLWDTVFGGTGADVGWSVQQTSDGGFVIAGVTESAGAGSWDACLVKTDAAGNETWTKTYGGPGRDYARSVQQTRDGGFILTGCTESQGAGAGDVYVIKTDAQGNPTWMRTYGGTGADEGRSVRQTADGGYIIAGSTRSFGVGGSDIYIIKTDSAGTSENAVLSKVRRAGQTR
ncbi:MAG: hypothetical protein R6X13_10860 [bacterium]